MSPVISSATDENPTACGGNLTEAGSHPYAIYYGKRIYFCSEACKRAFDKDPDEFMAGKIPHPIEAQE